MTQQQKDLLAEICNYVFEHEEKNFEEEGQPENHIYALARTAWAEFDLDYTEEPTN